MMLRRIDEIMEMNRIVFGLCCDAAHCCGIALVTLVLQCRIEDSASRSRMRK
jgi:hypothetical protein